MVCFLIDDDPDDQEIFELALRDVDSSYTSIIVRDGLEALEKLKNNKDLKIDLIILDINMPKMNGKECVIELKKEAHLKAVPTFLYSTYNSGKELAEAHRLGATGFITKPPSIPELSALLKNIIDKHVLVR